MGRSKIVDESEVLRWFREERTYAWMAQQYREKYNIETVPSMWSNFRNRRGLDRRITRNDDLIPWAVKEEHRWAYPVQMLRHEAREREGHKLGKTVKAKLDAWKAKLEEANAVVHYDPDTEDGWFYVPREPEDDDLIRRPNRKTTTRPARD